MTNFGKSNHNKEEKKMSTTKKIALFVGGTLFGSAGFKILGSKDAKKVYTHATADAECLGVYGS